MTFTIAKKKVNDPLAGIEGLNVSTQKAELISLPAVIGVPYEYPTSTVEGIRRNSFVVDTLSMSPPSGSTDFNPGIAFSKEGILKSVSIYASATGVITTFGYLSAKIYRIINGVETLVYTLACGITTSIPGIIHDNPEIVIRPGDYLKIGRDIGSASDSRMRCIFVLQPFR